MYWQKQFKKIALDISLTWLKKIIELSLNYSHIRKLFNRQQV